MNMGLDLDQELDPGRAELCEHRCKSAQKNAWVPLPGTAVPCSHQIATTSATKRLRARGANWAGKATSWRSPAVPTYSGNG